MPLLKEIDQDGVTVEFYCFTGKVVSEKKWSETEVTGSGGGGGGYVHQGTGYTGSSSVKISSKTTRHDQIILQNEQGKEKSFKFENVNLACREGNTLSVVWGIKKGSEQGLYIFIYNHASDETYDTGKLKEIYPPYANLWAIGLGSVAVAFIPIAGFIAIPALLYIPYFLVKRTMFIRKLKSNPSYIEIPRFLNSEYKKISNNSSKRDAEKLGAPS